MEIKGKLVPFSADSKTLKLLSILRFKTLSIAGNNKELGNAVTTLLDAFLKRNTVFVKLSSDLYELNYAIKTFEVEQFTLFPKKNQLHLHITTSQSLKPVLEHLGDFTYMEIDIFNPSLQNKVEQYYENSIKTKQTVFNNLVFLRAVIRYFENEGSIEILYNEMLEREIHDALNVYSYSR